VRVRLRPGARRGLVWDGRVETLAQLHEGVDVEGTIQTVGAGGTTRVLTVARNGMIQTAYPNQHALVEVRPGAWLVLDVGDFQAMFEVDGEGG
jgi:hypothetical protein